MKTPRELLLARHRAAEAKLDVVSQKIVAGLVNKSERLNEFWLAWLTRGFWREVIWPARRIWMGLAAAWVVIVAANLDFRAATPKLAVTSSSGGGGYLMTYREPEKWMTAFMGETEPIVAEPPKRQLPQPRTEIRHEFFTI